MAAALLCACSGGGSSSSSSTADGGLTSLGSSTEGSDGDESSDGAMAELVSIDITPADPTVEVVNGVASSDVEFTATAHYDDGSSAVLSAAQWSFDRTDLATINPINGVWTPTAELGGMGTVTVLSQGVEATTTATVIYKLTHDPEDVPPEIKTMLDGATTPDPSLDILYPYDRTVFPRGLTAPVMQWGGGADTDLYHIELSGTYFAFEAWQTLPNPSRFTLPETPVDVWAKLGESVFAGPVEVSYQRYDGSLAYAPIEHTWTLADASLTGAVYYWAVN